MAKNLLVGNYLYPPPVCYEAGEASSIRPAPESRPSPLISKVHRYAEGSITRHLRCTSRYNICSSPLNTSLLTPAKLAETKVIGARRVLACGPGSSSPVGGVIPGVHSRQRIDRGPLWQDPREWDVVGG